MNRTAVIKRFSVPFLITTLLVFFFLGMLFVVKPVLCGVVLSLLFIAETALIVCRYVMTGSFYPGSLMLMGLFEYDDELGYNLRGNFSNERFWKDSPIKRRNLDRYKRGLANFVTINSLRYRGTERTPKKDNHTFRVIVLGDSTAFGYLNDDGYTWPELLEKELNSLSGGNMRFEVMNLAVGGYRFAQSVERYLRDFSGYDVDMIINACFISDFKYNIMYAQSSYKGLNRSSATMKNAMLRNRQIKILFYMWHKSLTRYLYRQCTRRIQLFISGLRVDRTVSNPDKRKPDDYFLDLEKYRNAYQPENKWISEYCRNFGLLYGEVKRKHPQCSFFLLSSPVLMANHIFYSNPCNYVLPGDVSLVLRNGRGYDSSDPAMVEHHARYLAHWKLFTEFFFELSMRYGDCDVLTPFRAICDIPFDKRDDIFCDEFHLSNKGNELFAGEIAPSVLRKRSSSLESV